MRKCMQMPLLPSRPLKMLSLRCMAWAIPLSVALWLLIAWAAWGKPVNVYALVVECSKDFLVCKVQKPAHAFKTWEECEAYLLAVGVKRGGRIMGRCRSWSPAPDWRKE